MPAAAILFDLDGTLVDSERDNVESVVLAARRHGVELDASDRAFIVGHSWNEIYARVRERHGLDVAMDALIAQAVADKRELLRDKGHRPLPGALEAIARLGRDSLLAVVSGASHVEVEESLAGIGARAAFRVVLGAEDYGRGKPDPEPYATAMRLLGVVAARCVVIEDATPGILSGRAAGARVIAVRAGNFSGYDLSGADAVVDTLAEVDAALCDRLLDRGC